MQRYSIWSVSCTNIKNYGVLCRNIVQPLLHVTWPSQSTFWIWPQSLECFPKLWKMRQNNKLFHSSLQADDLPKVLARCQTCPIVFLSCSLPYILFLVHNVNFTCWFCRVNIEYMHTHLSLSSDIVEGLGTDWIIWNRADLVSILFHCARKTQKYYCPKLLSLRILVQGLFWGLCRNISFLKNMHLCGHQGRYKAAA